MIPRHDVYKRQTAIEERMRSVAQRCDAPTLGDGSPRYVRHLGKVKAWNTEKGYGFIRQDHDTHDAFAHIRDFMAGLSGDMAIPDGTRVEYDLADGTEPDKKKAINVLTLDWSPSK
jgi:cold shock CspA family protein